MKFLKLFPIFFLLNIAFAQQTIKDLTVNDFKVVNTKQGSKPCPEMTETQRNAIPSPQSARCIYNTTSGKLNIYNSTAGIWKAAGGGVDSWVTAFGYSVDDLVIQSNKIYQCLTAHTSGTFATDLGLGRWVEISKGVTTTGAATDNTITRYDGTSGELIQSSGLILDDSNNLSGLNNLTILGDLTLKTSFTGPLKATAGVVSAGAIDLSTEVVGTLPITNGGTGSTSKSWVDLTTNQGAIAGNKSFTGNLLTTGTMLASNLSGTNTGDLTTSGASGSTTITNKLKAPFRQMTPSATGEVDIETGNNNELINPRFEASTYNDGWTCSLGTMTQAVGPGGSKAMQVVSTGAGFRCRQTFTSSADLKGTLARFYARIKTAAPDVKICGLDGGILTANEVGCVTVNPTNANKVFDDPTGFFRYGDTLYGIVIYTNNTLTFPTIIDDTLMGAAGLTTVNFNSETGWVPCTFSTLAWQGLGTVTNNLRCKRSGEDLSIRGSIVTSGVSANQARIPLPSNWGAITSSSKINANEVNGDLFRSQANTNVYLKAIIQPSVNYFNISAQIITSASNPSLPVSGDVPLGNERVFIPLVTIPIAGWSAVDTTGILSSNADYGWTLVPGATASWTNTSVILYEKRIGDSVMYTGRVTGTGAPSAGPLYVNLPRTIDTAQTYGLVAPRVSMTDTGVLDYTAAAGVNSSFPTRLNFLYYTSGGPERTSADVTNTAPFAFNNTDSISFTTLPMKVVGWTQSPLAIIPLYTPLVHARAFAGSNVSVTSAVTPMVNIAEDATGIFSNAATLITATMKQAGLYNICFYASTDVANNVGIVISGAIYQFDTYTTNARGGGCWVQRLAVGEVVRPYLPTSGTMYGGVDDNGFSVTRLGD